MADFEPMEFQFARTLLTCLCNALEAIAAQDPSLPAPGVCCMRPGTEVPFDVSSDGVDMCCFDNGEAYVKIMNVYPSSAFPQPDEPTGKQQCQLQRLAAVFEIGVIRCVPDEPTCEERTYKVRQTMADKSAAFTAACCWGKAIQAPDLGGAGTMWTAGSWDVAGPDGLCVSGSMQLIASLKGSGCC